jgi:hypothetical protein
MPRRSFNLEPFTCRIQTPIIHRARCPCLIICSFILIHLIALKISRSTLSDRAKNCHVSFTESSQQRQTLAPEEESRFYLTGAGKSSVDSTRTSCTRTRNFWQNHRQKWHTKFEKRHREILKACPAKLDPKRTQNFNKASIGDLFDKYEGTHFRFDGMCSLLLAFYL